MKNNARTLSGLLLLSLLALLMHQGMQWFADPYRFPLNVVEVKGDFRYLDRSSLERSIAPFVSEGFFTVDVAAICEISEQLPWVYRAKVRRVWPDILRLQIEEQQPVARWGERGFLNRFGEAFLPDQAVAAEELPALAGPAGQERRVLEQYHQAATLLAPLGLQVHSLQLDQRRAWRLRTQGGVQMELGRIDVWERLQRLVRTYPVVFRDRMDELQYLDLRYSHGFSVRWGRLAPAEVMEEQA